MIEVFEFVGVKPTCIIALDEDRCQMKEKGISSLPRTCSEETPKRAPTDPMKSAGIVVPPKHQSSRLLPLVNLPISSLDGRATLQRRDVAKLLL